MEFNLNYENIFNQIIKNDDGNLSPFVYKAIQTRLLDFQSVFNNWSSLSEKEIRKYLLLIEKEHQDWNDYYCNEYLCETGINKEWTLSLIFACIRCRLRRCYPTPIYNLKSLIDCGLYIHNPKSVNELSIDEIQDAIFLLSMRWKTITSINALNSDLWLYIEDIERQIDILDVKNTDTFIHLAHSLNYFFSCFTIKNQFLRDFQTFTFVSPDWKCSHNDQNNSHTKNCNNKCIENEKIKNIKNWATKELENYTSECRLKIEKKIIALEIRSAEKEYYSRHHNRIVSNDPRRIIQYTRPYTNQTLLLNSSQMFAFVVFAEKCHQTHFENWWELCMITQEKYFQKKNFIKLIEYPFIVQLLGIFYVVLRQKKIVYYTPTSTVALYLWCKHCPETYSHLGNKYDLSFIKELYKTDFFQ